MYFNSINDRNPKVMFKKIKNLKNYLYTRSDCFLLFCLYLQSIVVRIIAMHSSLAKQLYF